MRLLLSLALLGCISLSSYSQSVPQLRVRLGSVKAFLSGNTEGNSLYQLSSQKSLRPSGFGIEYYQPVNKWVTGFYSGLFFNLQPYIVGINPDKFNVVPDGPTYSSDYGTLRLYGGLEKRITKVSDQVQKNYFSVTGGIGISYNTKGDEPGNWVGPRIGDGTTIDSKSFTGQYFDGRGIPQMAGYYSQVSAHRAQLFSPDLSAGIRYNVLNKKGHTVFVAESIFTLGLTNKYYIDVNYMLNGQSQTDRLKDKGTNVQVNAVIPLFSFRRK